MNDAMPGPRSCEVCGGRLRYDNTIGVCRATPECSRERTRRLRAARSSKPQKQKCNRGTCPNDARANGVCGMHDMRFKRTGDYGPDGPMRKPLVINPGDRFGRWTVLENYSFTNQRILCRCECGTERRVWAYILTVGESKSCGCGRRKPHPPAEPYMLAGEVHGNLTALEKATYGSEAIRFQCKCGTEAVKNAGMVKRGQTRSCGCLVTEQWKTHGFSRHPLYSLWKGIVRRCENPKDPAYKDYGANGRTICEGWKGMPEGFLTFVADMGERPPGMTTDRLDNKGGYWCGHCAECIRLGHPLNAAWRTPKQQNANRRTVGGLARENKALAARVAELEALLADCTCGMQPLSRGALF